MTVVTIHKAKTNLSDLIKRAEAGEEIIIARGDTPVVRLEPCAKKKISRKDAYGAFKDLIGDVPDDAFEPLSEEELKDWYGE